MMLTDDVTVMTEGGDIIRGEADRIAALAIETIKSELPEETQTHAIVKYVIERAGIVLQRSKVIL